MKNLEISDRQRLYAGYSFEGMYGSDTFYHYFPLILAISETVSKLQIEDGLIYVDENTLFLEPYNRIDPDPKIKNVTISVNIPPLHWFYTPYDTNFIYDLETTLNVKNFRDNVEHYKRINPLSTCVDASPEEATQVIENWYRKRIDSKQEFYDFGYTMWLAKNFTLFDDLKAKIVRQDTSLKPIAVSIYGVPNMSGRAFHIISKDVGHPYLQDYIRFETYQHLLKLGAKTVNDGSDVGIEGLRLYKLKLRPKYIIPIYSWSRTF